MITTRTLRRQVWMADDDEFNYIVKNTQRVLKLNAQYENHPYVEEFTEEFSVMFVYKRYLSEEETDANFFFFWGGVIYGIYFRYVFYQTTQTNFPGK